MLRTYYVPPILSTPKASFSLSSPAATFSATSGAALGMSPVPSAASFLNHTVVPQKHLGASLLQCFARHVADGLSYAIARLARLSLTLGKLSTGFRRLANLLSPIPPRRFYYAHRYTPSALPGYAGRMRHATSSPSRYNIPIHEQYHCAALYIDATGNAPPQLCTGDTRGRGVYHRGRVLPPGGVPNDEDNAAPSLTFGGHSNGAATLPRLQPLA